MTLLAVAGNDFALPVECVLHIVADPAVFPLAGLRSGVAGVFYFGEELVPMLQADLLTADGDPSRLPVPFAVICQSDYGALGLPVDRPVRIVDTAGGKLAPAPPGVTPPVASQVFHWQGESYPLLDLDMLLAQLPCP